MATVTIDLRMTATQRNAVRSALTTLETMLDAPKVQALLEMWPDLPPDVQQRVLDKAPLFARYLALSERMRT
jgi:hypothetical protein